MTIVEAEEIMSGESWLITWTREAQALHEVAESLVRTSFVPLSFKSEGKDKQTGKQKWRDKETVISETVAAILAGKEVGLQPIASLRSIQIISGTPAMTALAMRGLVQSAGHEITVLEQTETRAVVEGRRRGSERVQRSVWTIDRAERMRLTNKPHWTDQPSSMLVARATSECCRLTAADVLLGMPYSIEELQDLGDSLDTPEQPKKRTAKRAPLPDVEPPELEAPPAPETPAEKEAEAATDQGDDVCPGCGGELHPPSECPAAGDV